MLGGCSGQAAESSPPATVTVTAAPVSQAQVEANAAQNAPQDGTQQNTPTTRPVPANPVPILAKVKGCVIPEGATVRQPG